MSEPWNQSRFEDIFDEYPPSFENLMGDDSLSFLANHTAFDDSIDWSSHYPPAPQELARSGQPQPLTDLTSPVASPSPFELWCGSVNASNPGVQLGDLAPGGMSQCYSLDQVHRTLLNPATAEHDTSNMSQASAEGKQSKPKKKPHWCKESGCSKRFVHKGDLSRHVREQHTGEEYLCPWRQCFASRKGSGFKRMHRLVNHLFTLNLRGHPVARTYLDAEYIAMDHNSSDKLESPSQMVLDMHNSFPADWARTNIRGMKLGDAKRYKGLLEYLDRLETFPCPESGCPMSFMFRPGYGSDLVVHLDTDHSLPWYTAWSRRDGAIDTTRAEVEAKRKRSKKAK